MSRLIEEPVPSTPNFDFLHGEFGLSKWRIPYFATTLTFEEAAQYLHLPSEIPGGEQIHWSISELYQRNIDWRRVQRQIAPYLRAADIPQFFNSITIALLPYSRSNQQIIDGADKDYSWHPPELTSPEKYQKQLDVGPIRIGFWDSWDSFDDEGFASGRMRWNTSEIFAVALDGQHRLAAIKDVVDRPYSTDAEKSKLPVLFLVFHPDVGFVAPAGTPTVEVLRKLFIDLNKHARTVNRARQILLDDRDPLAVSVHAILAPTLENDVDSLSEAYPRLPLSLVDWFTEQAKFDTGPHLTTVLGLDWIVAKALETSPIADMTAYPAVSGQILKLNARLGINLDGALDRLADIKSVKLTPFTYSDEELDIVGNAFAEVWNGPLCNLLTKFSPYGNLITQRLTDGTLSLDWQEWYRLYEAQKDDSYEGQASIDYRKFLGMLLDRKRITKEQLEGQLAVLELLKKDNLAFNVVFQRALVLGFLDYIKIPDSFIQQLQDRYEREQEEEPNFDVEMDDILDEDEGGLEVAEEIVIEPDELQIDNAGAGSPAQQALARQNANRADEFIRNMNDVIAVDGSYLSLDATVGEGENEARMLWAGSLRKPEGPIDFTLGASGRARDLVFLTAAMSTFYRATAGQVEFSQLWVELQDLVPASCSFVKRMRMAVGRMTNTAREGSLAVRVLKARDEQITTTAALKEAEIRLQHLWDRMVESVDGTRP